MRRLLSILLLLPISAFLFLTIVGAQDSVDFSSADPMNSEHDHEVQQWRDRQNDAINDWNPHAPGLDDREEALISLEDHDLWGDNEEHDDAEPDDEEEHDEESEEDEDFDDDEFDDEEDEHFDDDEEDDDSEEEDDWFDDSDRWESEHRQEMAINLSNLVQNDRHMLAIALSEIRVNFDELDAIDVLEHALARNKNVTHQRLFRLHLVSLYTESDQPSKAKAHALALLVAE